MLAKVQAQMNDTEKKNRPTQMKSTDFFIKVQRQFGTMDDYMQNKKVYLDPYLNFQLM